MTDIKTYVKELQHLKSLGLLDKEQHDEIDNLIKVVENLENQNNSFRIHRVVYDGAPLRFINNTITIS
jgi:DNA-binding MltR family transcriptional regulator